MKKSIITLFLAAVSAVSCEPPMPPSDEEMIRHFATHEAAFRKVYEIMAESSEGSFHYPPLSPEVFHRITLLSTSLTASL